MCALDTSGFAECWGLYDSVVDDAPAVALSQMAVANSNACGIRASDGGLECWGNDSSFEQPPSGSFIDVALGSFRGCAVDTDGGGVLAEEEPRAVRAA